MDIEEYKKLARNKIEADALTQQVRDVIKITKWQKQDAREGFKETFKPLIKSQDSIKKSIDEQQNATIAQLKKNQLALTSGLEKINETNERLADIKELPDSDDWMPMPPPDDGKGWDSNWVPVPRPSGNLEKNFVGSDLLFLQNYDYPRPSEFNEVGVQDLEQIHTNLNQNIRELDGRIVGRKNNKNPSPEYVAGTNKLKESVGIQEKYRNTMNSYFNSFNYKVGKGRGQGIYYYNSPQELLKRLELLGGSLAAGNNGVLSEYIQIAHQLRDLGVVTNNQLNALLRKYINIR